MWHVSCRNKPLSSLIVCPLFFFFSDYCTKTAGKKKRFLPNLKIIISANKIMNIFLLTFVTFKVQDCGWRSDLMLLLENTVIVAKRQYFGWVESYNLWEVIFAKLFCELMCFKHCIILNHTNLMNKDFLHKIECFILLQTNWVHVLLYRCSKILG